MKKNLFIFITLVSLVISGLTTSYATSSTQEIYHVEPTIQSSINTQTVQDDHYLDRYMRVDFTTIQKWKQEYEQAHTAYIDPHLQQTESTLENYDILDLLDYVPSEHDQRYCGNCWMWPATSILSIALNVQHGIFQRLSVQYMNSCGEDVGIGCCEGGNLNIFTRFYRHTDMAIPWSNENALWIDKFAQCQTECDSIEKVPFYPISSIRSETIETHEIPEEEAINNIKNILHQQRGVYFSFFMPNEQYLSDFNDFWSDSAEDYVFDIDWADGIEYDEEEGAGHAVLCVGYNDEEGDNNDYWIMLNSWGVTSRRPTGLFRINMHMNYDATMIYQDQEYFSLDFETINVTYANEVTAPYPPEIEGPASVKVNTEASFQISTTDPQGDNVYYTINWGDGETTDWIGPYNSGTTIEVSHSWDEKDELAISVKAKDVEDHESFWSTLDLSVSKQKKTISMSNWFEEFLSSLFPFLS